MTTRREAWAEGPTHAQGGGSGKPGQQSGGIVGDHRGDRRWPGSSLTIATGTDSVGARGRDRNGVFLSRLRWGCQSRGTWSAVVSPVITSSTSERVYPNTVTSICR